MARAWSRGNRSLGPVGLLRGGGRGLRRGGVVGQVGVAGQEDTVSGPPPPSPRAAQGLPSALPSVRLSAARRGPAGRLLRAPGRRAGRRGVDPVTPRTGMPRTGMPRTRTGQTCPGPAAPRTWLVSLETFRQMRDLVYRAILAKSCNHSMVFLMEPPPHPGARAPHPYIHVPQNSHPVPLPHQRRMPLVGR